MTDRVPEHFRQTARVMLAKFSATSGGSVQEAPRRGRAMTVSPHAVTVGSGVQHPAGSAGALTSLSDALFMWQLASVEPGQPEAVVVPVQPRAVSTKAWTQQAK